MKRLMIIIIVLACLLMSLWYVRSSYTHKKKNISEIITEVMAYSMNDVIARCKKDFNYTDDDMQILEKEFKRYLILRIIFKDYTIGMYSDDVDNLWHSFILFTKEYAAFCEQYNGKFIHHMPNLGKSIITDIKIESQKSFQEFIQDYEKIFNEEIHPIWFLDMCGIK